MAQDKTGKELLENAYRLHTPDDNRAYYRDFAPHYDSTFAQDLGYSLPKAVAQHFLTLRASQDTPIADIGCGTGLIADHLPEGTTIDGFDISPDMLAKAGIKSRYRALHEADLTGSLKDLPKDYGAVLSSGTFTHGHLGPETLTRLLDFARLKALFVVSINAAHYQSHGFAGLLEQLQNHGAIGDLDLQETAIYTTPGHAHSDDTALLCSFRKST